MGDKLNIKDSLLKTVQATKQYVDNNFINLNKTVAYDNNAGEAYYYTTYPWGEEYPFNYSANRLVGDFTLEDNTYYVVEVTFVANDTNVKLTFAKSYIDYEKDMQFELIEDSSGGDYAHYEFEIGQQLQYYDVDESTVTLDIPHTAIGYYQNNEDSTQTFVGLTDVAHHITIYKYESDIIDGRQISHIDINKVYNFPIEVLTDRKINLLDYVNPSNMRCVYFTENYVSDGYMDEEENCYYYQKSGGRIIEVFPCNFTTKDCFIKMDDMVYVYTFDYANPYTDCEGKTRYTKYKKVMTYFEFIVKELSYNNAITPTESHHLVNKKYVDDVAANKVDAVEGKALVNTGEIARLSKVDNYNDAEVRGLIEDLSDSKADVTSIPTKVSQLTNDSGFLTAVPDTYATQAYVTDAINKAQLDGSDSEIDLSPYALTSDLALKADKTELHEHENQTILNSITVEHLTSMAEISDTLNGPRNYYNPEMITESVYLNSDGRLLANTTYFTTDYIPIAPGQTLYFYGANGRYDVQPNARFVGFFDAGKNFITGSRVENVNQITNTYENGAYIKVTMANGGWGLGYIENVYPGIDIKYGEIPESKLWEKPQKIDVFLPDDIYCTVGTTIELYNNQVCLQADKLHLNWCCDYGNAMKRKFSFEGTSALAGQIIPVTLEIYNDYNVLKYTKTIQIHVVAATITNTITCVPIGDSWTNQKPWPAEVINLSGEKVSFVGKFTATVKDANGNWREYNHEGRSGFSAYTYDGAHAYTFGNAGEDTYHAFYNSTTARFDWNNYVDTVLGGTQPGAVILQMGINGIAADNTGMVGHEVNMINLIRQDNADIPIFVTLPAYKGNQDGLGIQESSDGHAYHKGVYDYLEKQKVMNYCSLLYEACKDIVGVYFIPLNVCFDSEYNYGAQEVPVNPRATSIIEKIPMEAVHPQDYGYYQMADIVYSVMCGNLS